MVVEAHDHSSGVGSCEDQAGVVGEAELGRLSEREILPRLLKRTLINSQHACHGGELLFLGSKYEEPSVHSRFQPPGSNKCDGQGLVEDIVGRVRHPILSLAYLS